ncbi:MAG: hypothetical protein C4321_09095, partial [Chloroflexota bacterium]
ATFAVHQGGHDMPAIRARLFQALEDPNADVRGEAAVALAQFKDPRFGPVLERLLREDEVVMQLYFEAAREWGDPALLPALLFAAERWRALDEDDAETGGQGLENESAGQELPEFIRDAITALGGTVPPP